MKSFFGLLLITAAGYLVYQIAKSRSVGSAPMITLKQALPAGAKLTGKIEQTANTQPPGGSTEVVGFAIKNWAEAFTPDGQRQWIEVEIA